MRRLSTCGKLDRFQAEFSQRLWNTLGEQRKTWAYSWNVYSSNKAVMGWLTYLLSPAVQYASFSKYLCNLSLTAEAWQHNPLRPEWRHPEVIHIFTIVSSTINTPQGRTARTSRRRWSNSAIVFANSYSNLLIPCSISNTGATSLTLPGPGPSPDDSPNLKKTYILPCFPPNALASLSAELLVISLSISSTILPSRP